MLSLLNLHPAFEYDRTAIESGQVWRVITGHFTHWSLDHLFWDVAVFAVLGAFAERRTGSAFVLCVLSSALAITAGVWCLRPDLALYRGLSGIDSALFVMVTAALARDALRRREWSVVAFTSTALAAFVTKTCWETATGSALFVDAAAAGFEPVALAHAIGGLVGAVTGLLPAGGGRR